MSIQNREEIQVLILPEQNRPGLLSDRASNQAPRCPPVTNFVVNDRVYPAKRFADIWGWKSGTPADVRPSNAQRVGNDVIWNASNRNIVCAI